MLQVQLENLPHLQIIQVHKSILDYDFKFLHLLEVAQ